jgi:hypothetical protein
MNEATKIQLNLKKEQDRIFNKKVTIVLRKIQALKSFEVRQRLRFDLYNCNSEDLLDVLCVSKFKSEEDFISDVNAFLSLECAAYEYRITLTYEVGKMKQLTDFIVLYHRQYELEKQIEAL